MNKKSLLHLRPLMLCVGMALLVLGITISGTALSVQNTTKATTEQGVTTASTGPGACWAATIDATVDSDVGVPVATNLDMKLVENDTKLITAVGGTWAVNEMMAGNTNCAKTEAAVTFKLLFAAEYNTGPCVKVTSVSAACGNTTAPPQMV